MIRLAGLVLLVSISSLLLAAENSFDQQVTVFVPEMTGGDLKVASMHTDHASSTTSIIVSYSVFNNQEGPMKIAVTALERGNPNLSDDSLALDKVTDLKKGDQGSGEFEFVLPTRLTGSETVTLIYTISN